MYSQTGFGINNEFSSKIRDNFFAEIQQLDFAKAAQSAATINDWVEKTTRGKIKDLIPAGMW